MHDKIVNEITWVIGGAQGSGVDSAANIFSKTCAEDGLYIFGKREYYSNIKGEHSYFTVRVSNKPIRSHKESIDILVSFDAETLFRHAKDVSTNGIIIFNSELIETSINEIPTLDPDVQNTITEYCNYSGDVNQEGAVNLTDLIETYNTSSNFVSGYVPTDVNGNNFVDLTDITIVYNNATKFVSKVTPQ